MRRRELEQRMPGGEGVVEETGLRQLLAGDGAPGDGVTFQHVDAQAGAREIRRRHEPVVARADDDRVAGRGHAGRPAGGCLCLRERSVPVPRSARTVAHRSQRRGSPCRLAAVTLPTGTRALAPGRRERTALSRAALAGGVRRPGRCQARGTCARPFHLAPAVAPTRGRPRGSSAGRSALRAARVAGAAPRGSPRRGARRTRPRADGRSRAAGRARSGPYP